MQQRRQRIQTPTGEYVEVFWRGGYRQYSVEDWEQAFPYDDAAADSMAPKELDRAIVDAKLLTTPAGQLQHAARERVARPLEKPAIWGIQRLTDAIRWLDAKVNGR